MKFEKWEAPIELNDCSEEECDYFGIDCKEIKWVSHKTYTTLKREKLRDLESKYNFSWSKHNINRTYLIPKV